MGKKRRKDVRGGKGNEERKERGKENKKVEKRLKEKEGSDYVI